MTVLSDDDTVRSLFRRQVVTHNSLTEIGSAVKPVLQALLLADHIYQDVQTHKIIVAGTFDRLMIFRSEDDAGKGEPSADAERTIKPIAEVQQVGSPYAYINITEVRGKVALELRYVHLESHEVLFKTSPLPVEAKSPLDTVEVVIPIPVLPRKVGVYALEVLCENELLGAHRVVVQEISKPEATQ